MKNNNQNGVPPHDAKLEWTMIGTLLQTPQLLKTLRLKSEHFYTNTCELCYQVASKMVIDQEEVNLITFCNRYNQAGGKVSEVNLLFFEEAWYSSLYAPTYLKQLAELCAMRKIRAAYNDLGLAPKEFVEKVKKIEIDFVEKIPKTLSKMVEENLATYDERKKLIAERNATGLITGFKCIDNICSFEKGYLIILAAKPSIGKSALALNIAVNSAMYDQKVLFFSAEMSEDEILNRVYAQLTGVSSTKFKYCNADASLGIVRDEIKSCGENLKIIEAYRETSEDICRICKQESLSFKPDLVVVDYVQILKDPLEKGSTDPLRLGKITMNLKLLSQELGCSVLALSQVDRQVQGQPLLHHLKGSGSLEQDANVVLTLHRDDKEDVTAKLLIAKNRNGQADVTADLKYTPKTTKFYE